MPDEAETVARCVRKARDFLDEQGVDGEVLVADNGSTDGSQQVAVAAGATKAPPRGRSGGGSDSPAGLYYILTVRRQRGFQRGSEFAREAGRRGGKASRRTKSDGA